MSKAVLVMEMPPNCYVCELQCRNVVGLFVCAIGRNNADYCSGRPDYCPLRELPEYITEPIDVEEEYSKGTMDGWNGCIDAIIGDQ